MFFYRKLPTIILREHYTSFLQPLCINSHHVHLTVIVKRFSSSHWFSTSCIVKCHVCSEDGDGDSRLTRDQSRSRLFQLNPPKKINTAGSASAACNNTIRGKGREFGQLQIHTLTHTKMTFMVWMDCCGASYTLCLLSSPKMVWKIRKGKCYWVVTGRTASAAPQHYR